MSRDGKGGKKGNGQRAKAKVKPGKYASWRLTYFQVERKVLKIKEREGDWWRGLAQGYHHNGGRTWARRHKVGIYIEKMVVIERWRNQGDEASCLPCLDGTLLQIRGQKLGGVRKLQQI